jgi:hypothetical protein
MVPKEDEWTVATLREHILALEGAADRRYGEQFSSSQKAIEVGFAAQQMAMQTAFSAQKEAVTAAFSAQKEAVNAALAAAERAVLKAEASTEKRFDAVNEFRKLVNDIVAEMMPRREVDVIVKAVTEKLTTLDSAQAAQHGIQVGWGYAIGAFGLLVAIIEFFVFVKK